MINFNNKMNTGLQTLKKLTNPLVMSKQVNSVHSRYLLQKYIDIIEKDGDKI